MELCEEERCVIPGEDLSQYLPSGAAGQVTAGSGVYVFQGRPVACLAGRLHVQLKDPAAKEVAAAIEVTVKPWDSNTSTNAVIEIDDVVIARVTRVTVNQALVDIVAVGDHTLQQYARGTVRREDVRTGGDVDALVMHECFRPGDLLRAAVISLGDARQYFLSTSAPEWGVVWARSKATGNVMIPKGFKVCQNLACH
jgi:exosome complex RNA-binding protein Csl4